MSAKRMNTAGQVTSRIAPATLDFLKDLKRHNGREPILVNIGGIVPSATRLEQSP